MFLMLLMGILSPLFSGTEGEDIDFNPRLLNKELSILLSGQDFQIHELILPDSIIRNNRVNGKFFTIMCRESEKFWAYIGRVNSCRAGGCTIQLKDEIADNYEYFDYFILFNSQKQVAVVRVFNYEATHGQEIMVKGWLNQFIGYDGARSLRVGKEIDSISGATISVDGLVADVQAKSHFINAFFNNNRIVGQI
ncbi:MAG: FMN-binding protein [Bacteroidia bacterium]|nr:FMN-binding protein [Bacteroidia bacterium]